MSYLDSVWHSKVDRDRFEVEYVYILRCPISRHVVYVGKSKDPFKRLLQHTKSDTECGIWIRAIKYFGFDPLMEFVDCSYGNIFKSESHFIDYYRGIGMANFNHTVTSWGNSTSPYKKYFTQCPNRKYYTHKLPISYYYELFKQPA